MEELKLQQAEAVRYWEQWRARAAAQEVGSEAWYGAVHSAAFWELRAANLQNLIDAIEASDDRN